MRKLAALSVTAAVKGSDRVDRNLTVFTNNGSEKIAERDGTSTWTSVAVTLFFGPLPGSHASDEWHGRHGATSGTVAQ